MGTDDEVDALLAAAYAVDGPEANRSLYDEWAATYDETFVDRSGYVYPQRVAELFVDGFDLGSGCVLDVGCGTGVVGLALCELGVDEIDGVDISPEMLREARSKRVAGAAVYHDLIEADLTGTVAVADDHYAGVISAGTFTHGHLGPNALDELFRIARPGARCTIGINAAHFEEFGFRARLERRRDQGVISDVELEITPIYADARPGGSDQFAQVAVFGVR